MYQIFVFVHCSHHSWPLTYNTRICGTGAPGSLTLTPSTDELVTFQKVYLQISQIYNVFKRSCCDSLHDCISDISTNVHKGRICHWNYSQVYNEWPSSEECVDLTGRWFPCFVYIVNNYCSNKAILWVYFHSYD